MFCGYLCFLVSFPVCGFCSIYSVWTCSIRSVCYDTFIAIHTAKLRHNVLHIWTIRAIPTYRVYRLYDKKTMILINVYTAAG